MPCLTTPNSHRKGLESQIVESRVGDGGGRRAHGVRGDVSMRPRNLLSLSRLSSRYMHGAQCTVYSRGVHRVWCKGSVTIVRYEVLGQLGQDEPASG